MRIFLFPLILSGIQASSQDLETIQSVQIENQDYRFEKSIENYQNSENWKIWSSPLGVATASSSLKSVGKNSYGVTNLGDLNLETAWVEGVTGYGVGEKITFTIKYTDGMQYGTAYEFFGHLNIFNGYCKSLTHWTENSRIKTLKVHYNSTPVCLIELVDTWHFQTVSIENFFQNKYSKKYLDAPYRIRDGSQLSFEITEVYQGTKFEDVAVSEFLIEGAKN